MMNKCAFALPVIAAALAIACDTAAFIFKGLISGTIE